MQNVLLYTKTNEIRIRRELDLQIDKISFT